MSYSQILLKNRLLLILAFWCSSNGFKFFKSIQILFITMFRKTLLIGFFSVLSLAMFGQEKIILKKETLSDLQPQLIAKTSKRQVGYLFRVGEEDFQAVGYKGSRLEVLLKENEAAYKEFQKFKRKVTVSKVAYWLSVASFVSTPLIVSENDTDAELTAKVGTTLGVALVGLTTALITNMDSTKHLENAVEIYNQNLE